MKKATNMNIFGDPKFNNQKILNDGNQSFAIQIIRVQSNVLFRTYRL